LMMGIDTVSPTATPSARSWREKASVFAASCACESVTGAADAEVAVTVTAGCRTTGKGAMTWKAVM